MQGIIITMTDELPTLAGLGRDKFLIFPMALLIPYGSAVVVQGAVE